MQLKNLSHESKESEEERQKKISTLYDLSYDLSTFIASEVDGEDFHEGYLKDKKAFARLIKSTLKTERNLNKYFKELSQRVWGYVNWMEYYTKIKKGQIFIEEMKWQDEVLALLVSFTDSLDDAFEVGGQTAEKELGFSIGFTVKDVPAMNALRKYTLQLARDVTDTTKEIVKQSILRSIQLGENQSQATERLVSVIQNPKRAAKIAHTETIRAYSQGKVQVGLEVGARFKVWRNGQPGACSICSELHDVKVKIDEDFQSSIGPIPYPPGHPNCRCILQLEM